jgi:hypothetical protein
MKLKLSIHRARALHLGILLVSLLAACSWFAQPAPTPTRLPTTPPRPTRTPWPTATLWLPPTHVPTRTSTPKPPPLPPLSGRLLLETGVSELRWLDFDGERASLGEPIVSDLRQVALSPDGRYLVYSGLETPVTLLDLVSGEQRQLASQPSACFAWSPDGSRFTYTRREAAQTLYAYELANDRSTKITQAACGNFLGFSSEGKLCGELTCGVWLDEARLLFRRFSGSLPNKVTDRKGLSGQAYPYPELRADHSTIAAIERGQAALEELPELWNELERCPHAPYLLLRKDWATDSELLIAPVFSDFSLFQPEPLPKVKDQLYLQSSPLFVDRQCHLLAVVGTRYGDQVALAMIDPASLQEIFRSPILRLDWNWSGAWVGDPAERIAAIVQGGQGGSTITLVDLDSGSHRDLIDLDEDQANVIAWSARQ